MHLPGISGPLRFDRYMLAGLKAGGVNAEISAYDWTARDPGLDALLAYDRNQRQSQIIATKLTDLYRNDPRRTIYITSHSGGAGLLVWSLEKCPPDVKVDTIIFLAPALSPTYDLSKALSHVTNHAYVFFSAADPVLGVGTRTMGTIDRVKSDAAGAVGFTMPSTADPDEYKKLIPMPYLSEYAQYQNMGDHIGPMTFPFSQTILAPLLGGHAPLPSQLAAPATSPAAAGS